MLLFKKNDAIYESKILISIIYVCAICLFWQNYLLRRGYSFTLLIISTFLLLKQQTHYILLHVEIKDFINIKILKIVWKPRNIVVLGTNRIWTLLYQHWMIYVDNYGAFILCKKSNSSDTKLVKIKQ